MDVKETENQRILMKDNLLVKTKYELNLSENKLFNLLLYKFQKDGQVLRCKIPQKEIQEVIKKKQKNTINGIKEILNTLSSKKIWIEEKKCNGINSKWHVYNLINGYSYDDEDGTFEVEATAFIYELIKKKFSDGGYTPNNLNIFLTLGNYYAQRLYELLRLWSNTKNIINYKVDELKELLMLENNYPKYSNFKRRVIDPAIKELNNSGAFQIEIEEFKKGRKVDSINFIVKDLDKRVYFMESKKNNIDNSKDKIKETPVAATTEVKNLNKYINCPLDIFEEKYILDFLKYCSNNIIEFSDENYNTILQETLDETYNKKGKILIGDTSNSYSYFLAIFKNKISDYEEKVSREIDSWINI